MRKTIALAAASAAALFMGAVVPHAVSAHYVFNAGQYRIAIGWQVEPAFGNDTFVGVPNAIQVFVDIPTPSNPISGTPVSDLNQNCPSNPDFTVSVSVGTTTSSAFCPAPAYDPDTGNGRLDEYDYALTPTVVGTYTFHITGKIHGVPIDQTIKSGSSTFDSVEDSSAIDFPVQVPPVSDIYTKVNAVDGRTTLAQSAASSAQGSATAGVVIGIVGAALALISGVVALAALRKARSKA